VDPLSDSLLSLKVKSVIITNWQLSAPWGVDNSQFDPVICLCVVEGSCWFDGGDEGVVELQAGDSVLSTKGKPCSFSSSSAEPLMPVSDIWKYGSKVGFNKSEFPGFDFFSPSEILGINFGGGGAKTRIISLAFDFSSLLKSPLLSSLPDFIIVKQTQSPVISSLHLTISSIVTETSKKSVGHFAIASHLAELILIGMVRDYIQSNRHGLGGWLQGLSDENILKALTAMHTNPERQWSLQSLADISLLSRTRFVERFRQLINQSPIAYLSSLRVAKAETLLLQTNLSVQELSEKVGFNSERAFRRVFKSQTGIAPSHYRKREQEQL